MRLFFVVCIALLASTRAWPECEIVAHPSGAKYVECEPEKIKAAKEEAERAKGRPSPTPGHEQSLEEFKANMEAAIATTEAERAAAKAKAEALRKEREHRDAVVQAKDQAARKKSEIPAFDTIYDRFKDQTELWAPPMKALDGRLTNRVMVQVFTNFPGKVPTAAPPAVRFAFRSINDDGWKYLKCHGIAALVESRPWILPETRHSGDVISGSSVLESVSFDLPWDRFVALTKSKAVEFRLCTTEIRVNERTLESWRALVAAGTPKNKN